MRRRRRRSCSGRRRRRRRGVVGRKHGLEIADLGLFNAGVRHLYVCDSQVSFWRRQNREGQTLICLLFSAKTRYSGSFLNILKLDRLSCATRYICSVCQKKNAYPDCVVQVKKCGFLALWLLAGRNVQQTFLQVSAGVSWLGLSGSPLILWHEITRHKEWKSAQWIPT